MDYQRLPHGHEVRFTEDVEVVVVREAFKAYNASVRDRGNEPLNYHVVIEKWRNAPQSYNAQDLNPLKTSLENFAENTEADADAELDKDVPARIGFAAHRLKLGYAAERLLENLDQEAAKTSHAGDSD